MVKNILDQSFRYTPAVGTDLRETFRKERLRLKRIAERQQAAEVEAKTVLAKREIRGRKS